MVAGGTLPDAPNFVWQLDLRSMTWKRYETILPSFSMQKTAISANWRDELLVVYGGLTKLDDLSNDDKSVNFYTSDIWVYYLTRRQWFKVRTSGRRPCGRIYASLIYVGNNSFILFAGATMELPRAHFKNYPNPAVLVSNEVMIRELCQEMEPRKDLWLLELSECGESCSESGITFTGHWTEMKTVKSSSESKFPGRMAHTAVLAEGKMFVFGGAKFLRYGSADCYDDIWSYDLHKNTWSLISAHSNGQGELSSSFRLCANPATVVNSRIVTLVTTSSESQNIVSYLSGRSMWANHNMSPPVVPDRFFTWRGQLLVVTQYAKNRMQ